MPLFSSRGRFVVSAKWRTCRCLRWAWGRQATCYSYRPQRPLSYYDIVSISSDIARTISALSQVGYVRYRTDIATYIGQISLRCRRSDNVALSDIGRRTNLSHPDIGIVSSVQYRCDIVCRRAISHRCRFCRPGCPRKSTCENPILHLIGLSDKLAFLTLSKKSLNISLWVIQSIVCPRTSST